MLCSARVWAYYGGWLCADLSCSSSLSLLSFSRRGQPRLHRRTISRPKSTCPMGSSRKALRAAEERRFSLAPSLMARFGAVMSVLARAQCSRTAAAGRVSVGIAYEAGQNRLWVAGGGPGFFGAGDVRVYDASSGDLLATFVRPGEVGFLNDVAITHDAVYVTDSFNPQLVKIPLPADGSFPSADSATLLPVTGASPRPQACPTSMGSSTRAACSSWRSRARGSSSASIRAPGTPDDQLWRQRDLWTVSTAWSCKGAPLRGAQHQCGDGRTARFSVRHRDRARRYHRSRPRRPNDGDRSRRAPVGCQRPVRHDAAAAGQGVLDHPTAAPPENG